MFSIIVWHRDATSGTHNRVLMSAKTEAKVLRDFAQYMTKPAHCRSFSDKNLIQLHSDEKGFIRTISQEV